MNGQPKFIDIVRATGLKRFLIATANEHNKIGWAFFKLMMDKKTSAYRVHKLMDIPRARAEDLITLYEEQYKK